MLRPFVKYKHSEEFIAAVIKAHFELGLSYRKTAKKLKTTVGVVAGIIHRYRKRTGKYQRSET